MFLLPKRGRISRLFIFVLILHVFDFQSQHLCFLWFIKLATFLSLCFFSTLMFLAIGSYMMSYNFFVYKDHIHKARYLKFKHNSKLLASDLCLLLKSLPIKKLLKHYALLIDLFLMYFCTPPCHSVMLFIDVNINN